MSLRLTPCFWRTNSLHRARPLLGTIVAIRVEGLPRAQANDAIEQGFAEVERVHRLMSFHEDASDVSRANREAAFRPVQVDPSTFEVVRMSQAVARASGGAFDISVGGRLVERELLPQPRAPRLRDTGGSWRDIELGADDTLRFHRPLWIDLGGIAKGYAVDRAVYAITLASPSKCVVNAGGDMRVAGTGKERVLLAVERPSESAVPVLEIENASVASSGGGGFRVKRGDQGRRADANGGTRAVVGTRSFVSVVAPTCMVADALTKVVLTQRRRAEGILEKFGGAAYWHNSRLGWRTIASAPLIPDGCLR